MLQLGIIGCGRVTTMFHLRALNMLDDIEIVALSDINKARLNDLTKKTGVQKAFTDYRKLIRDPEVSSVVINTPPQYHSQMVLDSLEGGKHVLCEKPLAQDTEDLERIKNLTENYNLIVLPAHNYAFSPCLDLAQNFYENLGKVESIEVLFKNNLRSYRSLTDFRTSSNRGIVEDVLPHLLSVIMPFAGHPVDVMDTYWWCSSYDVCDNLETSLLTEDGINISCGISWTSLIPRFSVIIEGSKGRMITDLMWNPYSIKMKTNGLTKIYRTRGLKWYLDLFRLRHPGFKNLYLHFDRVINGFESPRISLDDEIVILKIMEKVSNCFNQEVS